ncbi:MAG: hypothetical protein ACOYL5_10555 [Phototrophicaceae bacterium]
MTPTSPLDTFMTEIGFTAEDLSANRGGHLSQRQRHYLQTDRNKNAALGAALVTLFTLTTALLLWNGLLNQSLWLQGLAFLAAIGNTLTAWMFGRAYVQSLQDLRDGTVYPLEGAAQHVIRRFATTATGSVRIGDTVEVQTPTLAAFKAFEPGARYRVYRTAVSGRLVAVEPLAGTQ